MSVPPGIAGEIAAAGGRVTFARFMELALTHPTEGYYSGADILLGPRGHFSTAPTLSPEFNEAVARLLEELVTATGVARGAQAPAAGTAPSAVNLVELGGGQGELAKAVLERLGHEQPAMRGCAAYTIVEVGERLRARQRRALARPIEQGWRVAWAPTLAAAMVEAVPTIVVGNEFMDALPVHLVDVRGEAPREAWVEVGAARPGTRGAADGPGFGVREVWGALSPEAAAELRTAFGTTDTGGLRALSRDGHIELRPEVGRLMRDLGAGGAATCLLTVDYGAWFGGAGEPLYGRTLRGYLRHQLVSDAYARVGSQDLTADVDFRALDLHGRATGLEAVLYTTVAGMLRGDSGLRKLERLLGGAATSLAMDRRATVLQGLLDDEGPGGAFRVMLQVRG